MTFRNVQATKRKYRKIQFPKGTSKYRLWRYQVPFCSKIIFSCSCLPVMKILLNDTVFYFTKNVRQE